MEDTSDNSAMNRTDVRCAIFVIACSFLVRGMCAQTNAHGGKSVSFQISTTSFPVGGLIPKRYTCDGRDLSPALTWSGAPQGTKSFALIADDPDAPVGTWTHWLVWNIPASTHQLSEGVPKEAQLADGTRQGQNDFRKVGYNGPCPPPGKPHRYFFKLFALDSSLDVKPGASRKELEAAMKGHVLAQTEVMGRYGR